MTCLNCGKEFEPRKGFVQKFCPGGTCRSQYHNRLKLQLVRDYRKTALPLGHTIYFAYKDECEIEKHAQAHCNGEFDAAVIELVRKSLNSAEIEQEQSKILEEVKEWQPE